MFFSFTVFFQFSSSVGEDFYEENQDVVKKDLLKYFSNISSFIRAEFSGFRHVNRFYDVINVFYFLLDSAN